MFVLIAGDDDQDFFMQPSGGVIIIASKLDAEKKSTYDLTIGVTDGFNEITQIVSLHYHCNDEE